MSSSATRMLMGSISQLCQVPHDILALIANEIQTSNVPYKILYDDYQSGGWHTAMIYAPARGDIDGTIRDGQAVPTTLSDHLPVTRQFLQELGLDFFAVRIASNDPDSWLWEHRDYIELDEGKERARLHIPLVTNTQALIQFSQYKIHMAAGWIWKLDPTVNHAICNTGTSPRIHLILDCYMNDTLHSLLKYQALPAKVLQPLAAMDLDTREELLLVATRLLRNEGSQKAEEYLLRSFHSFDLGEETSYDLLIDLYAGMGYQERENHWITEKISRIHHRAKVTLASVTDGVKNSNGIHFRIPHSSGSSLQHFGVLTQVLQTCRQYQGLKQAYVRGSLARGDMDPHSDIDLLCVITPQDFISFISNIDTGIKERHLPVTERWVDTIVKDFGGVGFVYILETATGLIQLDLYVACYGHPSMKYLHDLPQKMEIFRQNCEEITNERLDELSYRLHAKSIEQEIQRINRTEPSVDTLLTELILLGFMIKKYLARGDSFVASSAWNMWNKSLIELVRHKFDIEHRKYGFYHVSRLIDEAEDNGVIYNNLLALISHPLDEEQLVLAHRYFMYLVQELFPEAYAHHQRSLCAVSEHIKQGIASRSDLRKYSPTAWCKRLEDITAMIKTKVMNRSRKLV